METYSRAEKMVGELLGLRLLVAGLLEREASASPDIIASALTAIEDWPIGSDTPEGAERIRRCARNMLAVFPASTGGA